VGFYNFYKSLIKGYLDLASLLTDFTKKDQKWQFGALEKAAFAAIKAEFKPRHIIAIYNSNKPNIVEPNASNKVISAVLSQPGDNGKLRPIAIFLKKFSPIELNYKIHNKKLLAIIKALKEWRYYLKGAKH